MNFAPRVISSIGLTIFLVTSSLAHASEGQSFSEYLASSAAQQKRRRKIVRVLLPTVVLALVGVPAFRYAEQSTSKGPHDPTWEGRVETEHELYGNVISGYKSGDEELTPYWERKAYDLLRSGDAMHLYGLTGTRLTYKTTRWNRETVHTVDLSKGEVPPQSDWSLPQTELLYIQTDGDAASPGDHWEGSNLGRMNGKFSRRGIRITTKDNDGKNKTKLVVFVNKDFDIKFTPRPPATTKPVRNILPHRPQNKGGE